MTSIEKIEKIFTALNLMLPNGELPKSIEIQGCCTNFVLRHFDKDLNAIHELEQLVIQKFGVYEYGDKLIENTLGLFDYSSTQQAALFATADAKTRIAAMLAVIEEKK